MAKMLSTDEALKLTSLLIELANPSIRKYIKLPTDNIIFGQITSVQFLNLLFKQCVFTKEHPDGVFYENAEYQVNVRVVDGKVLRKCSDGVWRLDSYAWKITKVLKQKDIRPIGVHPVYGSEHPGEALKNLNELMATVKTKEDRDLLYDFFVQWGQNLLLVHTEPEDRMVIRVTKPLLEAIETCYVPNSYDIDSAMKKGTPIECTEIHDGDALVIEKMPWGMAFYVVKEEEFELTHSLVNA